MVWLVDFVALQRLRIGRGVEERKVALVQYMEVLAPLDAVEKNVGCIFVMWSNSDEIDNSVSGEELKYRVVKVGEWY